MKKVISILSVFLSVSACTSVSVDDLVEPVIIEPGDTVNFTDDIRPIMENNCTSCHSNPPTNGASTSLVTFNDVKFSVENLGLIDRISREAGEAGAMPLGGPKLPQNLIDLVIQWEADGFLED